MNVQAGTISAADFYGNRGLPTKTVDRTQPRESIGQEAAAQAHAVGKIGGLGPVTLMILVGVLVGIKYAQERG